MMFGSQMYRVMSQIWKMDMKMAGIRVAVRRRNSCNFISPLQKLYTTLAITITFPAKSAQLANLRNSNFYFDYAFYFSDFYLPSTIARSMEFLLFLSNG